jgi:hypothetical protein
MKLSCFEKSFGKIASPTTSFIVEREMREKAAISYFSQLHPSLCLCERGGKTASPMKLFWK